MGWSRWLTVCAVAGTAALGGAGAVQADELNPSGPIPVTNQHPFYVYFLNPTPDGIAITEPGKFSVDSRYTMANVNVRQFSFPPARDFDRVELDMEIHRLDLDFRYGLTERMDIQLDIPYLIFYEGFLDSVVTSLEDVFGLKAPSSRKDWGFNEYRYVLRYHDKTYIDSRSPQNGLGDISSFLRYRFLDEGRYRPSMAARFGVKFPTGSDTEFLGSGKFDYSLGLLLQKQYRNLFVYGNADYVFITQPDFLDPMPLDDRMLSGFVGLEYLVNSRLSLLVQSGAMSTPYPDVHEVTSLSNPPVHIGVGFNFRITPHTTLRASVVENATSASADLTPQMGLQFKF